MTRTEEERRDARLRLESEIETIENAHAYSVRDRQYIPGPAWTAGERERVENLKRGIGRLDAADAAEREAARPAFEATMRRLMANPDMREDVPFCVQRDLFGLAAEMSKDGWVRIQGSDAEARKKATD